MIPIMDYISTKYFIKLFSNQIDYVYTGLIVRPFNIGNITKMRMPDQNNIDQLITVKSKYLNTFGWTETVYIGTVT